MARHDVFGIVRPKAATIATTIGVVRLPGKPPTECLYDIQIPRQAITCVHHRASEAEDFRVIKRARGAGGDEVVVWISE